MILAYIITGVVLTAGALLVRGRAVGVAVNAAFYTAQAAFAVALLLGAHGPQPADAALPVFTADATATLFFALLAVISPIVWWRSIDYLDEESPAQIRFYNASLILLCVSLGCVYFANNIAVTWIFIEATTLCSAGLIYHRRTPRSLEATWKYVFVCSVGIAIAYLGILLFGTVASGGTLSYRSLAANVASGNPLFMKMAFLFVVAGYSCKMEIFPLYPVGIDANHAAPSPASALISTGLVNAGFVALFRLYKVMEHSEVFEWARYVLVIMGLLSVLIGAVFLRRTRHFKRLLAYSTVENMGVVAIGLGVGGVGVLAAVLHAAGHSLVKSSLFLQAASLGKTYGHYQTGRMGDYLDVSPSAGALMLVSTLMLVGFPPSPLFFSELMIFRQMAIDGRWWMLALLLLMLCAVIYNLLRDVIRLCYRPLRPGVALDARRSRMVFASFALVAAAVALGVWQAAPITGFLNQIASSL